MDNISILKILKSISKSCQIIVDNIDNKACLEFFAGKISVLSRELIDKIDT